MENVKSKKRKVRLTRKQRQLRFAVILLVLSTVMVRNLPKKQAKTAKAFKKSKPLLAFLTFSI